MSLIRRSAAMVAVALLALSACGDDSNDGGSDGGGEQVLSGFVSEPPPSVTGATLPDVSNGGADFEFVAPQDGLLVVYFGYTHCPDVCPTTLYDLKKALESMGDDADRVSVAMATIDPERDTDEVITGYLQSFIPDGHALRTIDDAELQAAADLFGVSYSVTPVEGGEPEVSHTPNMYLVDDQGELVLTWPFGLPSDAIATDLSIMLDAVDAEE